jgi:DNA adenine methylase
MLVIMTSNRAVSLRNVALDIVKVANTYNVDNMWFDRMLPPIEIRRSRSTALIVMAADPLIASPWFLLCRDLKRGGVKNVFYGPVEGRLNRRYIADWMREIDFIAVSNYVRDKYVEAGLRVLDVVHHGIDLEAIMQARNMLSVGREYLNRVGLDVNKHLIVLTVASSHPRKGLAWYDKVVGEIERKDASIKFLVITEDKGLSYFKKHGNLIVKTDFGKLSRNSILSLMANAHIQAIPSLSEGFGLPALEAMALGTPIVHAALPPLTEFSTGFTVPVTEITYYDKGEAGPSGIIFENHLYNINEYADIIMQVADLWRNKREAIIDYRARSWEKAYNMNIYNMYRRLLKYVATIIGEDYKLNITPYNFSDLPPIPPQTPITQSIVQVDDQPRNGSVENEIKDAPILPEIDMDYISEEIMDHITRVRGAAKPTKPLRFAGGDWNIKEEIIGLLVKSGCYTLVEVFGGSGTISMYAPREVFKNIIYNDKDSLIVNFFMVLKNKPKELMNKLILLPVSRELFYKYVEAINTGEINNYDDVEKAAAIFYVSRLSMLGKSESFAIGVKKSIASETKRNITCMLDYAKMWSDITLENRDFRDIIRRYDRDYTVFYCDPPHLSVGGVNRKRYYRLILTEDDMKELLSILSSIKGKFLLKLPEDHMQISWIREWIEKYGYKVNVVEHKQWYYKVIGEERPTCRTMLICNYNF